MRVARPSAQKARTQAANQIHTVLDTAPEPIRARQRHSGIGAIDEAAREPTFAPSTTLGDPSDAAGHTLATLARRGTDLTAEIGRLARGLDQPVRATAPACSPSPVPASTWPVPRSSRLATTRSG